MSYNSALSRGAIRVVVAQIVLTLLVASGFGAARGLDDLVAALYGGMVMVLVTGWLAWRLRRAGSPAHSPATGLGVIYSSWVARYMAVAMLLGAGLGYLKLMPLPLITTFVLTQLGFLAGLHRS
jgi:ATP synthase protein I